MRATISGRRASLTDDRVDRLASRRHLVDHRDVHVGVQRHRERPWNRRRGHDQLMRQHTFRAQRHALVNAEAVLFVDDDERELCELDVPLKQRMRSDDDERFAACNRLALARAFCGRHTTGQQANGNTEWFEPRREIEIVLFRENLRRRHDRRLTAMFRRANGGERRDDGLAAADVALDQAQHRCALLEIEQHFRGHAPLCSR